MLLAFVARNAKAEALALAAHYLDEKSKLAFHQRFDLVADKAIGYAVGQAAQHVQAGKPITVETRSWMAGIAATYVNDHAQDTAQQAGDVLGKILARFDLHPAVQALVTPATPVEPVTQRRPPASRYAGCWPGPPTRPAATTSGNTR